LTASVPKKVRVHELAKELGLTNKEALDLCIALGIDARSHSSSIEDAQADRVRRRAERDGLIRAEQPEEPAPVKRAAKKTTKKAAAAASSEVEAGGGVAVVVEDAPAPVEIEVEVEVAPAAPVEPPVVAEPVVVEPPPAAVVEEAPAAPAAAATVEAPVEDVAPADGEHRIISSTRGVGEPERIEMRPAPAPPPPAARRPPASGAGAPPARPAVPARPAAPGQPAAGGRTVPPPPGRPLSASGKPIPPPPGGRLMSQTGRPIPPPPGGPRAPVPPGTRTGPGARPGGPGSRQGVGTRPGGPPGGRASAPTGTGAGRPGGRPGGPGGGPGGPGGRPGGPGGGGRRPPQQRRRSGRRRRNREELQPQQMLAYSASNAPVPEGTIVIERGSSAQEFAPKLNRTPADVVRFLLQEGEMVTATMALTDEQMELFALEVGADVLLVEPGQQQEMELQALFNDEDDDDEEAQQTRPPVVTVMGHVDHGKTTLLDRIRSTNVVAGEAGGITQHIGAYQVERDGHDITFIDTPGHAAFTKMRARGAQVTDIVVLVVAADDGVMPQTIEAIDHARAAEVPIVVAVNKVDKDNADPQRVLTQLAEHELVPESWGGDTITVEMSAQQNLGVDDLLDQLLLVSELEELTANPTGRAKGVVLEANLDVGRGPVATILVDKGTLKTGDPIVAGAAWGRVRAMLDDQGEQIKEAGPSTPVQVLGLSSVPNAGDEFRAAPDEKTARTVAEAREQRARVTNQRADARVQKGVKLEDIFTQIQKGEVATLNLVLKADVQGSLEALTESLRKLEREDVRPVFVHRAVGGISENDITLAATTNATIIGFNVRPDRKARELADAEGVEIRTYEVIYQIIEDIERAMVGLLAPEFEEVVTGEAEVREVFRVPRIGAVAGCYVQSGVITRGSKVRFLREGAIIWKGSITSLKRFKDDVREVRDGFECGIGLSDFQDLKQGDMIETYEEREIART
jgi:translation initiation factor IF-2